MAAPLIVRLVMDAAGYLKTVDTAVASNTKLEESSLGVGKAMSLSADKQVAASLKATRALEAQVAGQRALAADTTKTAEVRTRANLLAGRSQARLNSSLGLSSAAFAGSSQAVKTGERDLGKFTRGALAGSGAANSLGRSLAFASTGFIAVAGGATLLASSIKAALVLAKTQRQVQQQLTTTGKSWDEYGAQIDQADLKLSHISGFTNQELLQSFTTLFRVTDNVSKSLSLNALAADVARGRNISLTAASNALAKAEAGSFSALRRLNIVVPQGATKMQALAFVQEKYAGQAAAGATVTDRFHAALVNAQEIVGTALLPTFTRLTTELTNWLAKMTESGKVQGDANELIKLGGDLFHALGTAIGVVDKITGGFANTLKILVEVYLGRKIVLALVGVDKLAASWAGVTAAANTATAAEERATAVAGGAGATGLAGAAAGADAGLVGGLAARRAAQQATQQAEQSAALRSRVAPFINRGVAGEVASAEAGVAGVGTAAVVAEGKVTALSSSLAGLGALVVAPIVVPIILNYSDKFNQATKDTFFGRHFGFLTTPLLHPGRSFDQAFQDTGSKSTGNFFTTLGKLFSGESLDRTLKDINNSAAADARKADLAAAKQQFGALFTTRGARFAPGPLPLKGGGSVPFTPQGFGLTPTVGPSPSGQLGPGQTPIAIYAKYTQTITEQLAVAQAALTKTTKDDVAAARRIIARIKSQIDKGHLAGASLVQALQDEATQQGVLDNARQAAAAQAAKIAAAKQAAASTYTTPIDLQLAEARAQLTKSTADDIRAERGILAAAKAAIASGKKNKKGELVALQIELQAKQALDSLTSQTAQTVFTLPQKLQLALARDAALGIDPTKDLLKAKAALLKFISTHKKNFAALTDAYNQLAGINQQLGSSVTGILGNFKQASTRVLTAGLGLTPAQRKALRARLSQLGPGGTVPGGGVGAGGFIIDPTTGRPIRPGHGGHSGGGGGRGAATDGAKSAALDKAILRLSSGKAFKQHITVVVELDGKQIASSTTTHQQRRRARNPSQRRGPNAGN